MKKGTFIFSALLIVIASTAIAFKPAQTNNANVVWTQLVQMDATQANSTSESRGLIIFRLTSDGQLTYKITVPNPDDGDVLTNAHIHTGAPGVDGPPVIFLTAGVVNLNRFQTVQLTTQQYDLLMTGTQPLYVNVHSHDYPGDSIRGQIR